MACHLWLLPSLLCSSLILRAANNRAAWLLLAFEELAGVLLYGILLYRVAVRAVCPSRLQVSSLDVDLLPVHRPLYVHLPVQLHTAPSDTDEEGRRSGRRKTEEGRKRKKEGISL